MEIFLSLIFIPFLVSIFANRVDGSLVAPKVENFLKRLKQDDQQANHEIQKALRIAFLSAQQNIARECHKELLGTSPVKQYRGNKYYPLYQVDLYWLDQKIKQLAKNLTKVKTAKYVEMTLSPIDDDIVSLLTSSGQLGEKGIQLFEGHLLAEALKDGDEPELYKDKISRFLLQKMQEQITYEIKFHGKLSEVLQNSLIPTLIEQNQRLNSIEELLKNFLNQQLPESRRRLKLKTDIEEVNGVTLAKIEEYIREVTGDKSITIQRIQEGCMELIFDGSQKGLEKLDALVKSGQLKEILGIPIQDVLDVDSDITLNKTVVNLSQWLQKKFEPDWQTVEEVLGTQKVNLVFAVARSVSRSPEVIRAKQITLEMQSNSQSLDIVVAVTPEANQKIGISLQVHPADNQIYLPQGLKFSVLDTSGEVVCESQARDADNLIQLEIGVEIEDHFIVKIAMGNASATQDFIV